MSIDIRAKPERNESVEAEVRRVLRNLDELLDIRWFPHVRCPPGVEATFENLEGRYALVVKWPSSDGRWELYQKGEIGEPFDILGYFEEAEGELSWHGSNDQGSQAVDPLSVMDRAIELIGRADNTRQSWRARMAEVAQHNRDLAAKRKQDILDEAVDGFKHYRKKLQGSHYFNVLGEVSDEPSNAADA